jgi:hypothetical protein
MIQETLPGCLMLTSFRLVTVGSLGYQDLLALAVSDGERERNLIFLLGN